MDADFFFFSTGKFFSEMFCVWYELELWWSVLRIIIQLLRAFKRGISYDLVSYDFFSRFPQKRKKNLRLHLTLVSKFGQTPMNTFGVPEIFLFASFFYFFLSFSLFLLNLMLWVLLLHQRHNLVKYDLETVSVTLNKAVNNNQHF